MFLAIIPTLSRVLERVKHPFLEMLSWVGLKPVMPVYAAGILVEPPVSVPIVMSAIPVATDTTVSAAAVDGAIESLRVTSGSSYTNGTYYAAVYGDGTSAGTASGAIIKITVASNVISAVSTGNTGIQQAGAAYTFGTVNLGSGFTFSDITLETAAAIGGSGSAISVVISPKSGHGSDAVSELGGHYIMLHTSLEGSDNDDFLTGNDFRNINLVADPTTFGTSLSLIHI